MRGRDKWIVIGFKAQRKKKAKEKKRKEKERNESWAWIQLREGDRMRDVNDVIEL